MNATPLIPESFEGLSISEQFIFLRALISEAPVERFSELLLHFELFFLDADTRTHEEIAAHIPLILNLTRRIGLETMALDEGLSAEAMRRSMMGAIRAASPYAKAWELGEYREYPQYRRD